MSGKKTDLHGFKVLCARFSSNSTSQHEMFMKEHSVRNQTEDKPVDRTLFMINVPPWATEESIRIAFSVTTSIESVSFDCLNKINCDNKATGFKSAYAVFKTPADLYKALKMKSLPPLSTSENPIITGMSKWIQSYNLNVTSQKQREEEAMTIIKNYDKLDEARKLKEAKGETDDEGWTTVTKTGRNPGISRKESVNIKLAEKMMKKDKILKNFYRHQIRQEKRDQLATLRKKAEEDKKKILVLKQRRAFNPF